MPAPSTTEIQKTRQMPTSEAYIGKGDTSIYRTIDEMRKIIDVSSKNPYIRKWAQSILSSVPVNKKFAEVSAIHDFVRDSVRYTRDPHGWEYIQTPPVLLDGIEATKKYKAPRPIGDCDDMTTLSLSLIKSVGYPVAIKVVGFRVMDKDGYVPFSHVYGLVLIDGRWYPCDTVRPDKSLGWEAIGIKRSLEIPV